jgi:NADH-quinone oxidoreductase subunit C
MNESELHQRLTAAGIAGVGVLDETARDPFVVVEAEALVPALTFLRDDPDCRMEMLHNLTAVERPECMELVYHVCSLAHHHALTLKVRCEQWDLLGVRFAGHPDPRRILLPEEWKGHPLRKDYVYPSDYGEIPLELDAVPMYEREGAAPREARPPREPGTPLEQPPSPFSSRPLASGGRTVEPSRDGDDAGADGDGGGA